MNLNEIRDLLRIVSESGLDEVEVEQGGLRIVVRRNAPAMFVQPQFAAAPYAPPAPLPPAPPSAPAPPAPASAPPPEAFADVPAAPAAPPASATGTVVKAPIVGTFYRAGSPKADPFVDVGTQVAKGDVLCIIEAMKLMNEIEAEVGGTVRQILVQNAQAVEFDQPLFVIEEA